MGIATTSTLLIQALVMLFSPILLIQFQLILIRAVINVWGELWTQPGIEHRAQ